MPIPSPGPTPRLDPDAQAFGATSPSQPAQPAQPRTLTIEQAEGNPNWIDDGIDKALAMLRTEIFNVLAAALDEDAEEENEIVAMPTKASATCFDCAHIDKAAMNGHGMCAKFNMVPPMFVIVKPEGNCPEFLNLDDEIPY